ncbi:MAG: hypothetical protein A2Z72_02910 [Omnitrophica bacterium RBG_13_46_9]|nr:MAG: hypothetical protein A2Z72_02910 [Omnitrophica bacterium RBG_13_46_9]
MSDNRYKSILIINTFGIGDVLFSTPLIRAVKNYMPLARVDFMCNKRCQCILQNNRHIDDVIIFEKDEFRNAFKSSKVGFIRKILEFTREIKRKKYDLAIDLSLGYQISLLLRLLGVKQRIGFNYRKRGRFLTDKLDIDGFNDKHVVDYYLDVLRLIGITDFTGRDLEFSLSSVQEQWAEGFIRAKGLDDKRLIGIAPGGGKSWGSYAAYRRWDPQNFSHVAQGLSKKRDDIFFLIFGSEEEKDLCRIINESLGGKSLGLCGQLSFPQSVALIKRCELLLCNDGGILHVGVSQGVETVSIFGPVNDKVYGPCPPLDKHKVVRAENVECRPCYKNFKHRMCDSHDCLKKIDGGKVLSLAEESIRANNGRREKV